MTDSGQFLVEIPSTVRQTAFNLSYNISTYFYKNSRLLQKIENFEMIQKFTFSICEEGVSIYIIIQISWAKKMYV